MNTTDFAAFITERATAAGYDTSGPRTGGRKKLAADTGMSQTSVGRMLNGQTMPAAEFLEPLGNAIGVHVCVLLEAAGVVSPGALTNSAPLRPQPPTVQVAAEALGITKPLHIRLLETIAAALLEDEAGTA